MARMKNFSELYSLVVDKDPDLPALVFPDQTLTHGQLSRLGESFAVRMRERGVTSNSRVTLRTPDAVLTLSVILGCGWLGAAFVPFAGDGNIPVALTPTHTLFDPAVREAPTPDAIVIDQSWSPALTPPLAPDSIPADSAELDWIWVHTSGTTGLPKFLALSQSMVIGRSLAVNDEFRRGSRHVLLAHVYSRPFLARAAAALLNLSVLYFDLEADEWSASNIDIVHGARALIKERLNGKSLSPRLPRIELQGSRLPDQEAIALLNSFDVVDDTYGASETSKSYSTLWSLDSQSQPEARGVARDSLIELLDPTGAPVALGEIGIVRVRNDYMAKGYLNDREATKTAFAEGWFYPGDMARADESGRLHFLNRKETVLNLQGIKVNAMLVDHVMRSIPGVQDAICFRNPKPGSKDELFAFVVFGEDTNRLQAIASLRHAVSERFGEEVVPRVIQPINFVPRKPDGAPDRAACADMVLRAANLKD
jgi:acyl-CoA synthetase (AMP-forming)/AMP-acid ligase II